MCEHSLMWEPTQGQGNPTSIQFMHQVKAMGRSLINSHDVLRSLSRQMKTTLEKWKNDWIASPIQIEQHMQLEITGQQMGHGMPNTGSESYNIHKNVARGRFVVCSCLLIIYLLSWWKNRQYFYKLSIASIPGFHFPSLAVLTKLDGNLATKLISSMQVC